MLNRKLSILHTHEDCITRCVSKVQQEGKPDCISHNVQMKAKLCIIVLKDYGNNLIQEKDNNVNGVDEMTSMLWDIIV